MKVKTTSRTWVVPAIPTNQHWLSLSNLDRVVNPTFVSVIFFYEAVLKSKAFAEIVSKLKQSLREVLVQFYPLAGRLALREDGLVDLHCNDAGVMFLEAVVDSELCDAGGRGCGGAQPVPALSGIDAARVGPGPVFLPDQVSPMPVLIIQVTQFRCKSMAIAVNWHHTVADGFSGIHFVRSWSEVASGQPLSLKPVHCRDILKPRPTPDSSLVHGYSTAILKGDELNLAAQINKKPAIAKLFNIGRVAIQKLRMVEDDTTDVFSFSTAEMISAYLWKIMVRARLDGRVSKSAETADAAAKSASTRFFMFVDGRKRLDIPAGYFGNVVCSACAQSTEADIATKSVIQIASLIRKANRSINEDYFQSLIDWVETKGFMCSKSEHVNSLGRDVAATFWIYFPLYEVDFGWGKPTFAARNAAPRQFIDGISMMPSPHGRGHMAAVLNLHGDRMERLEADPMFTSLLAQQPMVAVKRESKGENMAPVA
ncbi:hypothetical protein Mp_4g10680 [Marchantia polymorpha subsp. ruderalis]|uniref:BAHD family acyltransferase, clade V n=2 Tax=Marchantia polymorpha TaxID=3197 RepID=A0AAF6B8J6_MARPO|nr:hypothetical protein MARPO_0011s0054 [Marchantia polymorpha]BBN08330.1 hypothetical protein Mp_4g10680 [Marchantia polymorpha subsp. ruderalis]|eukprot:PTQ46366.1 hypothetical protein MARPO_0011s0054 [Marchantia polymorpha]